MSIEERFDETLREGESADTVSVEALLRSLRQRGVQVEEERLAQAPGVAEALLLAASWVRRARTRGATVAEQVRAVLELWRHIGPQPRNPSANDWSATGLPRSFHDGFVKVPLELRIVLAREVAVDPRFDAEDALELGRKLRGLLREEGRRAELEDVLATWERHAPHAYRSEPALLGWRVECALMRPGSDVHGALLGLAAWRGHLVPLLKLAEWCLYRGRVEAALAGLTAAWPGVRDSPRLFVWDIEDFAQRTVFTLLDTVLLRAPVLGEGWLRERLEPLGPLAPGWLERAQACRSGEWMWRGSPQSWHQLSVSQLQFEQQELVMAFELELRTRYDWPLGRTQLLHPWLLVLMPEVPRGLRATQEPSRDPVNLLLPAEWVLREWARVGSESRYRHPHAEAAVASALLPWGHFLRRLGLIDSYEHAAWRVCVTRALARLPEQFSSADDPLLEQEVHKALRGG
ncbi:hypothetical protein [Hyalangium versicolor]|uniref:hypothetical protein n=1 Tax=Hyalangium versicolor TaxID=2861190 RepID=UPI001CCD27C0|nr:hypothetical protein [Hyalangium versicolor]